MKRLLITLIAILLGFPLILGAILGFAYFSITEDSIPSVSATVGQQAIPSIGYEWREPVLGGIVEKEFSRSATLEATDIGIWDEPHITAEGPRGYETTAAIIKGTSTIWEGNVDELPSFTFIDNGRYLLELYSGKTGENSLSYGSFTFRASFRMQVEPRLEISGGDADTAILRQGDVLAVRLYNLVSGVEPVGQDETGTIPFLPTGEGVMTGYVGAGHDREPGEYVLKVTAGSYNWEITYQVEEATYDKQEINIDQNNESIMGTNSEEAQEQFRRKMAPLAISFDEKRYWVGPFLMPVRGNVAGDYGATQYLNGSSTAYGRNAGLDIDAEEDSEVIAPGSGRVVLAENLEHTGNTVVIEHGGGLKSYLYHMKELRVREGNTVQQGAVVGLVGNTGYTYQFPHLRYEVRLGEQTVNPTLLFVESSGLFYFEKEDAASGEAATRRIIVPESAPGEDSSETASA